MNLGLFREKFRRRFPANVVNAPTPAHRHWLIRKLLDSSPGVKGMLSIKKQRLLHIACSCLDEPECYCEVGTYQGKSVISAMRRNPSRRAYAIDNFSEFADAESHPTLLRNLRRFGLSNRVTFYNAPFQKVLNPENIPQPIGVYFYDGAHDERSQFDGIELAEPLLADTALVLVDDWRFAPDSPSYAKEGTMRAIAGSRNTWEILCELPARFNGDAEMWWNGVAVLAFKQRHRESKNI